MIVRALALLLLHPALALALPLSPTELAQAAWTNAARGRLAEMCALCERVDPSTDCTVWGVERVRPPLVIEAKAADAARFHARHMQQGPCFQHDSCCVLERASDGTVRCKTPQCSACPAKTECAGTPIDERYALLNYGSFDGENIAVGYDDPLLVTCGWLNSPGHRENILAAHTELGVGFVPDSNGCLSGYWTQAFGTVRGAPGPGYITVGSVMRGAPFGPQGKPVSALAYLHDPESADAAPRSVRAVIDGRCVALSPKVGEGGRALFLEAFDAEPGCHQAWFFAVDAAGTRHVYPAQGALAFAVGSATCPPPTTRLPAACEGADACTREGEARACYSGPAGTEGVGRCHGGKSRCTDGAFGACKGEAVPGEELCNGLDDDCDGQIDEAPTDAGASCTTTLPGRCKAGRTACEGGGLVCVPLAEPAEEICNGEDDDCDGEIDDGLGTVSCGVGGCLKIVPACRNGVPQSCVPGTPESAETCGNGLDEDCDGTPDQGCACASGTSRACYAGAPATKGVGTCSAGTQACEDGVWGACSGQRLPEPESCNGADDDCNGVVDDGFGREACGSGGCRVTVARCKQGTLQVCQPLPPAPEACNGKDDSCDGRIDEACLCRAGQQEPCTTGPWAHAGVGRCQAGLRTCSADGSSWGACSGEVLATDEVCHNAVDDDCDGLVDEDCPPVQPPPPPPDEPRQGPGCGCQGGAEGVFALSLLGLLVRRRR